MWRTNHKYSYESFDVVFGIAQYTKLQFHCWPSIASPGAESAESSESAESAESFQKAIKEEILSFEQDLLAMKQRASKVKIEIGTTEEKTALKVDCHEMEKFCKDLVDITKSQNQEIHELQGKTLETFEWAEEAKSRDVRNKDPRYQRLLKARALDPLSQKRLSRVQSKHMYLEQQMDEVNNKLDLEWEQHLDRCKSGGRQRLKRLEKASKETVYRVLVNHTNIIESQKTVLQQLEQRCQNQKPYVYCHRINCKHLIGKLFSYLKEVGKWLTLFENYSKCRI